MLDNKITVETPESIELSITPAGPIPRILAYACDLTIRLAIMILLANTLAIFDEFGSGLYLISYFVLDWFYCVLFEVLNNGMTPGKKAFDIQVIHDDGTPLNWNASMLRNLIRMVDYFPSFYLTGLISMCYSPGFKRLGDHAAGTLVAYVNKPPIKPTIAQSGSRPMPFAMEMEEQQAILAFAERSKRLSISRQAELADILTEVLPTEDTSNKNMARVTELQKIAKGIIGDHAIDQTSEVQNTTKVEENSVKESRS